MLLYSTRHANTSYLVLKNGPATFPDIKHSERQEGAGRYRAVVALISLGRP